MRFLQWKLWLVILPLATGAGLVAHILSDLSLVLGVGLAALMGIIATYTVWHRTPTVIRPAIKQRALVGVVAGALATLAYDLCRYFVVTFLAFSFWPFDIFTIFGQLLIGRDAPEKLAQVVGVLYHSANGIGFAVAFMFLFRRPGVVSGLLWAAMLELLMVALYPSWLNIKALNEFLSVSIIGHIAYGLVLGSVAHRALPKTR